MFELGVGLGVDGDGFDAHFAAGAQDTQRDFSTVGNQHFLEHGGFPQGLFDDEEGFVVFDRLSVLDEDFHDFTAKVGFDAVEHFHGFDDADGVARLDVVAEFDEGVGIGRGGVVEGADHR